MSRTIRAKPPIIVQELAEQIGIKGFQLIHDLVGMNIFVRVDQSIKPEVAAYICKQYGFRLEIRGYLAVHSDLCVIRWKPFLWRRGRWAR